MDRAFDDARIAPIFEDQDKSSGRRSERNSVSENWLEKNKETVDPWLGSELKRLFVQDPSTMPASYLSPPRTNFDEFHDLIECRTGYLQVQDRARAQWDLLARQGKIEDAAVMGQIWSWVNCKIMNIDKITPAWQPGMPEPLTPASPRNGEVFSFGPPGDLAPPPAPARFDSYSGPQSAPAFAFGPLPSPTLAPTGHFPGPHSMPVSHPGSHPALNPTVNTFAPSNPVTLQQSHSQPTSPKNYKMEPHSVRLNSAQLMSSLTCVIGSSGLDAITVPGSDGSPVRDAETIGLSASAADSPSTYAIALSSSLSARGKPPYFPDNSGKSNKDNYVDIPGGLVCNFCKNNGEREAMYRSHNLKDHTGKVTCPVLRNYTCPKCGTRGDNAHTIKYCPVVAEKAKMATIQVLARNHDAVAKIGGHPYPSEFD